MNGNLTLCVFLSVKRVAADQRSDDMLLVSGEVYGWVMATADIMRDAGLLEVHEWSRGSHTGSPVTWLQVSRSPHRSSPTPGHAYIPLPRLHLLDLI